MSPAPHRRKIWSKEDIEEDTRRRTQLRQKIAETGTTAAYAKKVGVGLDHLHKVLNGYFTISDKLLGGKPCRKTK